MANEALAVPPTAQEALAALERAGAGSCFDDYATIRAFIESAAAAAEADAWAKIEAWGKAGSAHRDWEASNDPRGGVEITLYDTAIEEGRDFGAPTRLAALQLEVRVWRVDSDMVHTTWVDGHELQSWLTAHFRKSFTWVSDPQEGGARVMSELRILLYGIGIGYCCRAFIGWILRGEP